jgi:dolichol-phosphate mannosyltransferase
MKMIRDLDVIVPVYNEAECLEKFYHSLLEQLEVLKVAFHVIFINDGSQDGTQNILVRLSRSDKRVRVLELSRNFGHQAAITCGLHASTADWVITMDGDGEHPPEKIPEMITLGNEGYDMVQAKRESGQQASWLKRFTSDSFYRLLSQITSTPIVPGVGDFRLMNRMIVNALNDMPERHRFLRGMVAWLGFRTANITYTPAQRMGGKSKYSLKKMLRLAIDAIFSFSLAPIILCMTTGGLLITAALVIGIIGLVQSSPTVTWHPLLVFLILFCTGVNLLAISVIGYYSGLTFQQVKMRQSYIVRSTTNYEPDHKEDNE